MNYNNKRHNSTSADSHMLTQQLPYLPEDFHKFNNYFSLIYWQLSTLIDPVSLFILVSPSLPGISFYNHLTELATYIQYHQLKIFSHPWLDFLMADCQVIIILQFINLIAILSCRLI